MTNEEMKKLDAESAAAAQREHDAHVVDVYTHFYGSEKADRIAGEIRHRGSYITEEMYAEYDSLVSRASEQKG